jgi:hypothetical protein
VNFFFEARLVADFVDQIEGAEDWLKSIQPV